jgi:ABC-type nitrate/sulfonate/bicarbonate transport system substrate-binding protein
MRKSKSGNIIFAFTVALLALSSPHRGDAQQGEKVRVALGSISVSASVIPIGQQAGLFSKHGVDVEPIYMGGGMNSLAAVTSNSVQLLAAGSTATISARLGGMDITMLSVQSNKLDYTLFAAPEIKTAQDLKGKIVTGTRPGASADSALRLYLRRSGMEPGKDVIFVSVGDSQQGRLNALQRGSVSATVLTPALYRHGPAVGLPRIDRSQKNRYRVCGKFYCRHGGVHQRSSRARGEFSQGFCRVAALF